MQKYFYLAIVLLALGFSLCVGFIESRAAGTINSDGVDKAISQLEDKYFQHQYDSETDTDRLNRLEEFIYGKQQTGTVPERVKYILSTIIDEENNQTIPVSRARRIADNQNNQAALNNTSSQKPAQSSNNRNPFDYGSYPRVANLEKELLNRTYPNESLPDRLARLETKAYGAPSASTDLCQRVDLLDDYAQRHDLYGEHKSVSEPPPINTTAFNSTTPVSRETAADDSSSDPSYPWHRQQSYTGGNNSTNNSTFVGSAEERVSMMEAQEFKRTYTDKSLDQRLKKLAKKIVPDKDIANLPPNQQTVLLWDTLHPDEKNQVAALAANPNASDDTADNTTNNNSPTGKPRSWLHRLANAGNSWAQSSTSPNANNQPTAYGTNNPYWGSVIPNSANSHFIGASVGPGAGPAGLPIGFW